MIKWEALIRPKEFGGLGFTDVRVINTCLMVKWIDKLERGDNSLCCSLLRRKYLRERSIFSDKQHKRVTVLEVSFGSERMVSKRKDDRS